MRSIGRGSVLALVAALTLFVGVNTASAGVVSYFGSCFQNGFATTTPGPLQLRAGWATSSVKLTEKFLTAQSVAYSVNGSTFTTPQGDRTGWGAITQTVNGSGETIYRTDFTTPPLVNLASGESATVSIVFMTRNIVWDDAKTHYGPGDLWTARTCTVTAS
jgi:hypothetical protein